MKILVVSDIHANRDALNAVLDSALPSCSGLFCLGDLTGYGPDTEECVRILRGTLSTFDPCVILAGNHDAVLSGVIPAEWFNKSAQASVVRTKKALSRESFSWLATLPSVVEFSKEVHLSHGSPVEPLTGYLWGGYETVLALSWLADRDGVLCFSGHTHEAAVFSGSPDVLPADRLLYPEPGQAVSVASGPVIVNPGSAGFPRSYNGGRTADMPGDSEPISEQSYPAYFAVWDTDEKTVTFRDARYDRRPVEDRIDAMK